MQGTVFLVMVVGVVMEVVTVEDTEVDIKRENDQSFTIGKIKSSSIPKKCVDCDFLRQRSPWVP